jgi:hypothetical protein
MSENQTTEAMVKIVGILTPLVSEERQRVIKAALTLLGETFSSPQKAQVNEEAEEKDTDIGLPARANSWAKQNGLTMQELEQVFHFDGGNVEFIASEVPGKNLKDKAHNAYVICGVQNFLTDGTSNFDDKTARKLCETQGFYNQANHAVYLKSIGNVVTGSKDKGWVLTSPGLKKAASIIKELASL